MTKTKKIILTIILIFIIPVLTGAVREIAPAAGWIRIVINLAGFAFLVYIWTGKKSADKTDAKDA